MIKKRVKKTYVLEELGPEEDDGTMVNNVKELGDAVIGHRIVSVETSVKIDFYPYAYPKRASVLTLDNGTRVALVNEADCCAYTELASFLVNPNAVDHVITGIGTSDGFTTWHIFADMGDVLTLNVNWSAGNPFYYGYGFTILVENIDG